MVKRNKLDNNEYLIAELTQTHENYRHYDNKIANSFKFIIVIWSAIIGAVGYLLNMPLSPEQCTIIYTFMAYRALPIICLFVIGIVTTIWYDLENIRDSISKINNIHEFLDKNGRHLEAINENFENYKKYDLIVLFTLLLNLVVLAAPFIVIPNLDTSKLPGYAHGIAILNLLITFEFTKKFFKKRDYYGIIKTKN